MAELLEVHACMPSAERGQGILVDGDARTMRIAYCNGRSVVLRSLLEPAKADIYCEHAYPTTVARFSPNGQWVASADVSGTVRIWGSGVEHPFKCEYRALSGRVDDLQWSADGERIVICGDGKGKSFVRAIMWDTGTSIGEFDGSSRRVLSCGFKPTRPFRIATGGEDFLVNFYEGPPFKFKASHREHNNFVNCVRFSPNGSKFITVGSDKKVVIYDGKSGDKLAVCSPENGHTGSIYAASWSDSSDQVLTVSADKTAKIWTVGPDNSASVHATFSFTGCGTDDMQVGCLWLKEFLITFSLGGAMNFLSSDSSDRTGPKKVVSGHMKSITAVVISGSDIYSSSYDGVIIKWQLGNGYVDRLESKGLSSIDGLAVAGDVLVSWGQDKALLINHNTGEAKLIHLGAHCFDLSLAARSSSIGMACTEQGLLLLQDGSVVSTMALTYQPTAVALSPDGTTAVVGTNKGDIYLYSVASGTVHQEAVLQRHRGGITVLKFSPDGSMFASGDQNREALVWDTASREVKMKNMLYHTARLKCIAWSLDGCKVATGSVDGCVYVYDINRLASNRVSIKAAHTGAVSGLAFKDDNILVTGGDDACLRVWSIP